MIIINKIAADLIRGMVIGIRTCLMPIKIEEDKYCIIENMDIAVLLRQNGFEFEVRNLTQAEIDLMDGL